MKSFKEFQESVKPKVVSVPTDYNATKTSNALIKHFGAKKRKSYVNNPYESYRSLEHTMDEKDVGALHKHLVDSGWKHEEGKHARNKEVTFHDYTHENGGHINVTRHTGKGTNGKKPFNDITVWGSKKAKPRTIPYYD